MAAPALMLKFQQAERRNREGLVLSLFWETSQNYHTTLCLNLIGQNLFTWSHLAAREAGTCKEAETWREVGTYSMLAQCIAAPSKSRILLLTKKWRLGIERSLPIFATHRSQNREFLPL